MARPTESAAGSELEPDPVIERYKAGVDRTLIRAQARRSIDERIAVMTSALALALSLGEAGQKDRTR